MDIYKVTFLGPKKKPVTITEDLLIAKITDPIPSTYIPKSLNITKSNLTVFKGKFLMDYYKIHYIQKLKFLIIQLGNYIQQYTLIVQQVNFYYHFHLD